MTPPVLRCYFVAMMTVAAPVQEVSTPCGSPPPSAIAILTHREDVTLLGVKQHIRPEQQGNCWAAASVVGDVFGDQQQSARPQRRLALRDELPAIGFPL